MRVPIQMIFSKMVAWNPPGPGSSRCFFGVSHEATEGWRRFGSIKFATSSARILKLNLQSERNMAVIFPSPILLKFSTDDEVSEHDVCILHFLVPLAHTTFWSCRARICKLGFRTATRYMPAKARQTW